MIQKVTLKTLEIVENEHGEFEERYVNPKTYPAKLTNYALKKAKERGLLTASVVASLFDLIPEGSTVDNLNQADPSMIKNIDEINMQKTIYIGLLGAKPELEDTLPFDDFLKRYHETFDATMEIYMGLIDGIFSSKETNNFAKELVKSTKNEKKK